jgi:hypothetical protein
MQCMYVLADYQDSAVAWSRARFHFLHTLGGVDRAAVDSDGGQRPSFESALKVSFLGGENSLKTGGSKLHLPFH